MVKKYGLIGYPLSHSFSPKYFAEKFEREKISAEYSAYPIENIEAFLNLFNDGISGLNVTIPYKEQIMSYLDEIEEEARVVGAVNTVKREADKLVGYNTDIYGFRQSLLAMKLPFSFQDNFALILGTGGASKAIKYVLEKLGMRCSFGSRRDDATLGIYSYESLSNIHLGKYKIIVNTTPLGMYPNETESPDIPMWDLAEGQLVYDLIYNPEKTVLLKEAESLGCIIKNGQEMLELQAEKSWQIWSG